MGAILSKIGLPEAARSVAAIDKPAGSRGLVEVGRNFGQVLRQLQSSGRKIDLKAISAQALSLLQSGMPISTIVNQIAHTLAGKVASALSHASGQAVDDVSKNKLFQAFASALAPPGGSPPGSSAEQAQALADKLLQLVANIAGDAANAGQQNRFAGPVLDADTAKEIPAQQRSQQNGSSDSQTAASFIESVLADAAASLHSSATHTMPVVSGGTSALQSALQLAQPDSQVQSRLQAQPQIQTENQGQILGRIIARAATAGARFSQNPVAAATPVTGAAQSKSETGTIVPGGSNVQPAMVRASLENLVGAIVQSATTQNGNATGNSGQNAGSFGWTLANDAFAQTAGKAMPRASDGASFAAQAGALLGPSWPSATSGAQAAGTPDLPQTPYTTVDANGVIDQVIKGLQIKSFGSENSEVRMRLSPENLGDVSVKLTMNGGNITASITAQNADVRDTLLANQNQLSKSLADAGLKLQNFSVNVSGGGQQGFSQHQDFARNAGSRRIAFHIGETDETQNDVLPATPTFGPPLAAVQTLGLLNYLA